jgi:dihydrofolate synthase/folylpolyglutamate synthase
MDSDTRYQQALDYLYSFVDYSLTRALRYSPEKFNLSRMVKLAEICGNPQKAYPIIHISGTKGKGSTAAMIASCLNAAGFRVGLYTSPHLSEFTERIQVDGEQISKAELANLIDWLKPYVTQVPELTTFELTTLLGFEYFKEKKVDFGVIEVGLGGRLDATNIVEPLVSVITALSMDHMSVLGNTLEKIAFEKGGIIKQRKPVVLSPQKPEAEEVIQTICKERNSSLIQVNKQIHFCPEEHDLDKQVFQMWCEAEICNKYSSDQPIELTTPLLGYHQMENAATAFAALSVVQKAGYNISETAFQKGYATVKWPARFEILQHNPPVIVDSAHNRDSALKLRRTLQDYLPGKPFILVFGASEDKDVEGMFAELLPGMVQVIATQSVHPRALDADEIVRIAEKFEIPARAIKNVTDAVDIAFESAGKTCGILATGSLFIAAAVRDYYFSQQKTY